MFLNEEDYLFTSVLKQNYRIIKQEALKVPETAYFAWPEKYLYGSGWKVYGMIRFGKILPNICPRTTKILSSIPKIYSGGFSLLKSGAEIQPHKGKTPNLVRCHLAVKVPPNCVLKVAGKVKQWQDGKILIFDDTSEHSAYNRSKQDRLILIVDVMI